MLRIAHLNSSIILAFLVSICISGHSYAQQVNCSISGKIIDIKGGPIEYASVALYEGSYPVSGVVTNVNGDFQLKTIRTNTKCILAVEYIGYAKFTQEIIPDRQNFNLGTIVLEPDMTALNEAVVSAKGYSQKATVEHTTINASSNISSSKGTAMDILRTASSVTISDEVISIRGNSNILVLLDGVPTTATDLSTIPAINIKSIEVITNPDVSHDASGTGGIINIISKKISTEGLSGMISANYGFSHFVNANVALSVKKPKSAYRFSYNTRYEDDIIHTYLERYIKATEHKVEQKILATKYLYNNNISLGADFPIGDMDNLAIDLKCIIPRNNLKQDLHNMSGTDESKIEEFRHNDVTWNRENIECSIGYTHIFLPDVSDVSIKGSISKIWGHRPSYYYLEGEMSNRSNSGGSPFISALQADYKHKLKIGMISTGVKFTYRRNDIFHEFYNLKDDLWEYSETLSSDLVHSEFVPAAYLMFASRIGNKISYKAGLRGEMSRVSLASIHGQVNKTQNSFFLAPGISGTYAISNDQELSLALSRRIGRPTYPQLNPYMSMVDAITYEQGNMYLLPEKSTKLDLSYSLKSKGFNLFLNGYMNCTEDYISQITKIDTGRLITTYANADSDCKYGLDLSMRFSPIRWLNLSIAANTYYVSTTGWFEGAEISNRGITNNSNVTLDFLLWKGGDIQCQYYITTPQYFPQLTTALIHQTDIGFKQKLMKGSLTLSVLVTDLFNTAKWQVSSQNNIFDLKNISYDESQMLWLGISYNFNSYKHKPGHKKETDRSLIRLGL